MNYVEATTTLVASLIDKARLVSPQDTAEAFEIIYKKIINLENAKDNKILEDYNNAFTENEMV